MARRNDSTGIETIVPRKDGIRTVRDILRHHIYGGPWTVAKLASHTGIKPRRIESYMSETEDVEAPLSVVLSICKVLGEDAVNAVIAEIGYVAQPVDAAGLKSPAADAVAAMEGVARFAKCAIDNHIDHIERPICTEAADNVIELMAPYSSRGGR